MAEAPKKIELIPFVKIADVKAGDVLIADPGFTCLKAYAEVTVQADADGELFVLCRQGFHGLEGQIGGPFGGHDEHTHYVGFWKK